MRIPFYLTESEAMLLKKFGLHTPEDLIDFYRRKQYPVLRELFVKTVGAMRLASS